ncbi:type II CAAX endopeptidase family protein [Phenylobacterium sp.]|uniref:CPBP family intramembrane glutamic endopeptidase n=1 Tax=Phenylobacterium sp. TaxID=1871053 RepID=UPI002BACFA02|nr:type II CAAX endopeptidase family protein [Phenylobacterium sp.]HLZ76805.1 type II CAAX endopeptidase family protein [Phenylobacterium sp.]
MAAIEDRTESRARVISAAEVACAAWAVIGHNVLHVLPNEVPILVLLALVSMRWREGGWAALGFVRPKSWRLMIALAVGAAVLRLVLGDLVIEPLAAHVWPPIVAPKGAELIPHDAKAALAALALVWTFAAFGEEIGYRGYLMKRIADVGGGGRLAWIVGLLGSAVLFGFGHFYKGPAGILDSGVAGLILGGVYLLSGRCLWTTILAHGMIDTTAVILTYLGLNN